jgi:adenine phosphoribosyltransferase
MTPDQLKAYVCDVPDFPKPGIVFKDITPLLSDAAAFRSTIDALENRIAEYDVDALFAIESRGFIFGASLAERCSLPMHLVRKPGRLPREVASVSYELEYGVNEVEIHTSSVQRGGRYLVVDDLLATGGTAAAAIKLVRDQGGVVVACAFVIELEFLDGRKALGECPVVSLITY